MKYPVNSKTPICSNTIPGLLAEQIELVFEMKYANLLSAGFWESDNDLESVFDGGSKRDRFAPEAKCSRLRSEVSWDFRDDVD